MLKKWSHITEKNTRGRGGHCLSNENKKDDLSLEIALEPPPAPETPVSHYETSGQLFAPDDDSLAQLNARFTMVDSFLRILTRDLKFNDFVRELLLVVMKVVKSEAGSIFEVDHSNNTLFFRAVIGQSSENLTKFTIPMGQGIVGHVAESRQHLIVDDAEANKLHLSSIAKAVGFETRNLIAVPVIIRGRVYGVLELLNRVGEPNFTKSDIELLNYFCEMAAKTIEVRFMLAWSQQNRKKDDTHSGTSSGEKGNAA
jgi:putative methionine-R-sulfoxide reductase with GAF domain